MDKWVGIACALVAAFWAGVEVGLVNKPLPTCQAENGKLVAYSIHTNGSTQCVYIAHRRGLV